MWRSYLAVHPADWRKAVFIPAGKPMPRQPDRWLPRDEVPTALVWQPGGEWTPPQ